MSRKDKMYKRVVFTLHSGSLPPQRQNVPQSKQAILLNCTQQGGSHGRLSTPSPCSKGEKKHKTSAIFISVGNRLGFCQHQFRVALVQVNGFEVRFPLHNDCRVSTEGLWTLESLVRRVLLSSSAIKVAA